MLFDDRYAKQLHSLIDMFAACFTDIFRFVTQLFDQTDLIGAFAGNTDDQKSPVSQCYRGKSLLSLETVRA